MVGKILRRFSDFKGKQRLARFLMFFNKAKREYLIEGKGGCRYMVPNLTENIGFELYINGVFEENYIDLILSHIPENGVFIDLGSNIGAISIPICKYRPDIKSYAVEASKSMMSFLNTNLRLNEIYNCKTIHRAVWKTSGTSLPFFTPEEQYGKGKIDSKSSSSLTESVITISLDDLCMQCQLKKIDFIKVDIEGFEYYAFKGGYNVLRDSDAPDILFEFIASAEKSCENLEPGDAQSLLLTYGYALYKIDNDKLHRINSPLTNEYAMIYATKKSPIAISQGK